MAAANYQNLVQGLVESHGEQLRRFLVRRVRNPGDVGDLIQEIYLRMLRVPDKEAIRSPEAYLFTVARHVVYQHTLRQSSAPIAVELREMLGESRAGAETDPALEASAQECLAMLSDALDELSPRARAVFLLHRRDGVTLEEVGKRLGVSRAMAKKYFAQALVHFRKALAEGEE